MAISILDECGISVPASYSLARLIYTPPPSFLSSCLSCRTRCTSNDPPPLPSPPSTNDCLLVSHSAALSSWAEGSTSGGARGCNTGHGSCLCPPLVSCVAASGAACLPQPPHPPPPPSPAPQRRTFPSGPSCSRQGRRSNSGGDNKAGDLLSNASSSSISGRK